MEGNVIDTSRPTPALTHTVLQRKLAAAGAHPLVCCCESGVATGPFSLLGRHLLVQLRDMLCGHHGDLVLCHGGIGSLHGPLIPLRVRFRALRGELGIARGDLGLARYCPWVHGYSPWSHWYCAW